MAAAASTSPRSGGRAAARSPTSPKHAHTHILPARTWSHHPSFLDYQHTATAAAAAAGLEFNIAAPHGKTPGLLRVMSYNILAALYARGGFEYCPPEYLAWEYRWKLIKAEIDLYKPDIVCMQEVGNRAFDHQMKPFMESRGFAGTYCRYAGRDGRVGLATFTRRETCRLRKSHRLKMADLVLDEAVAGPLMGSVRPELATMPARPAGPASAAQEMDAPTPGDGESAADEPPDAGDAVGADSSSRRGATASARHGAAGAESDETIAREPRESHLAEHTSMWQWLCWARQVALVSEIELLPSMATAEGLTLEDADGESSVQSRILLVGNFHAPWNPKFPDAKAVQTALIVRGMARIHAGLVNSEADRPVSMMLCGDFNSMPRIEGPAVGHDVVKAGEVLIPGVHALMEYGMLEQGHPHHPFTRRRTESGVYLLHPALSPTIRLPWTFRSAYECASGEEPAWTNWHADFKETLDYIWIPYGLVGGASDDPLLSDPAVTSLRSLLAPLACLDVPSSTELRRRSSAAQGACPNVCVPSDHVPIIVDMYVS